MKTRYLLLLPTWLCAPGLVCGQDAKPKPSPPPVTLSYSSMNEVAWFSISGNTATAAARFSAEGGESLLLPVTVQAPLGTHLRVYADVYQMAGVVSTPWQRNIPVSEEIIFDDRTSILVACKLPELHAVQRKTQVSVVLRTDPKISNYPGGLSIRGFVYPREEPGGWQKHFAALLARSGVRRVAFFGSWKNPANFLRERKIAFDDLGDGWPAHPDPHTLYLGSGVSNTNASASLSVPGAFADTPGVRLVIFESWDAETLPPGVYQTAGLAGGGVWKVTLPDVFLGANLHNPHDLEVLTTILEQVLSPHPSVATANNPEPTPTP